MPSLPTTSECVARIDELEPQLHAFQAVRRDEALAEAAAINAALPLAGVPLVVKDNVDVAGLATRQGSAATSDQPAEQDDELVRRLRAAGCVVVGKSQMPELAVWTFTEPEALPARRNPVHPDRRRGCASRARRASQARDQERDREGGHARSKRQDIA
jgi:amidase